VSRNTPALETRKQRLLALDAMHKQTQDLLRRLNQEAVRRGIECTELEEVLLEHQALGIPLQEAIAACEADAEDADGGAVG